MPFENRRSTVHPVEASSSSTASSSSSFSSCSFSTTKPAKPNRRRSIFAKLVKRSSADRPEPSFVIARSDQPMSALFSPTRQVHSMDEEFFRLSVKPNRDGGDKDLNVDAGFGDDDDDSNFRPPAFLVEQLKRDREAQVAAQKRRHSVCASSQRLQAKRMMDKMEKIRAFDDLIQSGKTKTIKLSLTPELAV